MSLTGVINDLAFSSLDEAGTPAAKPTAGTKACRFFSSLCGEKAGGNGSANEEETGSAAGPVAVKDFLAGEFSLRGITESLLETDNILLTLVRDYRQAGANYIKLMDEHGPDSAITLLAREMLYSAKASVETRLHELALYKDNPVVENDIGGSHSVPYKITRAICARTLETAKTLRKRREQELMRFKRKQKKERERNADIAGDTLVAFFLLSMFSQRFSARYFSPFIDFSESFRRASSSA